VCGWVCLSLPALPDCQALCVALQCTVLFDAVGAAQPDWASSSVEPVWCVVCAVGVVCDAGVGLCLGTEDRTG
jgi:hypothetical protein